MMTIITLFSVLCLATVFAVAGVAKVFNRATTRETMTAFGVPAQFAGILATFLPLVELVVAASLLVATTARVGAYGALAMLVAFTIAIAANLARGRTPGCPCFGQAQPSPIGWTTLVRNAVLLAMAAAIAWAGPPARTGNAITWTAEALQLRPGVVIVAIIALAFGAGWTFLLFELFRQNGRLLVRLERVEELMGLTPGGPPTGVPLIQGLAPGTRAPSFEALTLRAGAVRLENLQRPGRPLVLLFADPKCQSCAELMPEVVRWQASITALSLAVVSRESADEAQRTAERYGLHDLILQRDGEVARLFEIYSTPAAVKILPDGTVAGRAALGRDEIARLIGEDAWTS